MVDTRLEEVQVYWLLEDGKGMAGIMRDLWFAHVAEIK